MTDENDVYIAPSTNDVVGFARWMGRRWIRAFEDRRRAPLEASSNWASSIGHPCPRILYYQRTGAEKKQHSARTMMVFERGNAMERDTVDILRTEMGIDWIRSQVAAPKDDLNIGIRLDGAVRGRLNDSDPYLITEVKAVNAREFAKITDGDIQGIHDMLERCSWWIQKHPYQVAVYLRYFQEPGAIIIVREPSSWGAKFVPMPADAPIVSVLWDRVEERAKATNAAVEAREVPEPMAYDKSACGMCDYAETVCFPERHNEGVEVLTHPDVVTAAREFMEIKETVSRATGLQDYLREIVLATGRDRVILGDAVEAKVAPAGKGKSVRFSPLRGDLLFEE